VTGSWAELEAGTASCDVLVQELRVLGRGRGITSVRRLPGGYVADAWLVTYADGSRVVGKTLEGAPEDLFSAEAPAGWAERMPLLHVREHLSSIAHIGDGGGDAGRLRLALGPFYER
jgi:hypothetical protein